MEGPPPLSGHVSMLSFFIDSGFPKISYILLDLYGQGSDRCTSVGTIVQVDVWHVLVDNPADVLSVLLCRLMCPTCTREHPCWCTKCTMVQVDVSGMYS